MCSISLFVNTINLQYDIKLLFIKLPIYVCIQGKLANSLTLTSLFMVTHRKRLVF